MSNSADTALKCKGLNVLKAALVAALGIAGILFFSIREEPDLPEMMITEIPAESTISADRFPLSVRQRYRDNYTNQSKTETGPEHGFTFVRIKYRQVPTNRGWRGTPTWAYDYPTAELNLHTAMDRTTKIRVTDPPVVLSLDDPRIYEYPVLYLTEPGFWQSDEEEASRLREYLDRGGFLIIDDFHDFGGKGFQWYNMYNNLKMIFPDREPEVLLPEHPVWSVYFTVDPVEAASTKPGFGKYEDEYYAVYDASGRMMCVICYNQDIGDGWEWPDRNFDSESTVSFQIAVNFIIYAYTH